MNRQYFSEVVLDTVQANMRTQESFSAWDITKQVRDYIDNSEYPTEIIDCPLMDNGSQYNVQHDRVKALVHQYMNALLEHSNYDSRDTGKYIEYRYIDPDDFTCEVDEDLKSTNDICDSNCDNCPCSMDKDTKPNSAVDYQLDSWFTQQKQLTDSKTDITDALDILKKYGLIK